MPQTINEIFIDKNELIKDLNNFQEDKNVKYLTLLEEAYKEVEALFKNRFIPMQDNYCYDTKVNSCWLGLCKDSFKYISDFSSGSNYKEVLKTIQNFYKNKNIDIPTKTELKTLTWLSSTPFSLSGKRPSNPSCCMQYKNGNYTQTFDMDSGYLKDISSSGGIHPIFRLYKTDKKLSSKYHFLLWIANKLKPKNTTLNSYNKLLTLDIKIDKNFMIQDFSKMPIDAEALIKELLSVDKKRANLIEYDKKLLLDVNKGSWEALRLSDEKNFKQPIKIKFTQPLTAKDPKESITQGIIGIDFGTKSTVVVYQKNDDTIMPLRVGMGDWSKKEEAHHYENPTVMEFINLEGFLNEYKKPFRPFTKWNDVTISHTAYENLKNSNSNDFNAYVTELKQWAGDKNRKIKIQDHKKNIYELKEFEKITPNNLNPIELYAYYLGLYINNQHSDDIYLEYLLSFPVNYEIGVRKKILESFKRGLKKSLPDIGERIKELKVTAGVSEPAAYASIALQEYNLADEKEKNFYAIFDFGGGTTDFDFGIFRWSDEDSPKEERYDYVIEHFGAGGDKYLGGENLLELLAFEIFKQNKDILREESVSFIKPHDAKEFLGSELLLNDSREARLNMVNLIKKIRPFWEGGAKQDFFKDAIKVDLYDNNGVKKAGIELEVDEKALKELLENRIQKGIDNFFASLKKSFYSYKDEIEFDIDTINIFLAGNSSKSPIVKKFFDDKIKIITQDMQDKGFEANIKIYPPLDNKNDFTKPNGKTGVAFGLIETRPGGKILILDKNKQGDDIKFKYYLGDSKRKKFKVIIDRDFEYNKWYKFLSTGGNNSFDVYYTSSPSAITNNLSIKDESIKKIRFEVPKEKIKEDNSLFIKLISPNSFEYGIGYDENEARTISKISIKE